MKTKIVGNRVIISTKLTLAEIKGLQKNSPESLALFDEKDQVVFRVGFGNVASITPFGVTFNEVDPETGKCFLSFDIDPSAEDKAAHIAETFGKALASLTAIEQDAEADYAELQEDLRTVAESIVIVSVTE